MSPRRRRRSRTQRASRQSSVRSFFQSDPVAPPTPPTPPSDTPPSIPSDPPSPISHPPRDSSSPATPSPSCFLSLTPLTGVSIVPTLPQTPALSLCTPSHLCVSVAPAAILKNSSPVTECPEVDSKETPTPRRLHPFFAAFAAQADTSVAVPSQQRPRKRARPAPLPNDAWSATSATRHFNGVPPRARFADCPSLDISSRTCASVHPVEYRHVDASVAHFPVSTTRVSVPRRAVLSLSVASDAWADRFRRDRRIDVVNGAAAKALVDWLRAWYDPPTLRHDSSSDDDDSGACFHPPVVQTDRERVAIVTGSVGCGKSTVIANAARQLGLSILEINASICRNGKRIRQVIGDALSTHRVSHPNSVFDKLMDKPAPVHDIDVSSVASSFATSSTTASSAATAKTLILFEEVDQLHDDERGFWTTIQKLSAASDCRRPIICTANSFTAQMRQFFVDQPTTVEADLTRLFIPAKPEPLINPIHYKLIEFQGRSERQASAVMTGVCKTESADEISHLAQSLALICRDDFRRAINLLHFWGAPGLAGNEQKVANSTSGQRKSVLKRKRPPERNKNALVEVREAGGIDLLQAALPEHQALTSFHVGSAGFYNRHSESTSHDALEAWSTSLEAMSFSDAMQGDMERETVKRNFHLSEEPDAVLLHSDMQHAAGSVAEMNVAALRISAPYLAFQHGAERVAELAEEMCADRSQRLNHFSTRFPLSRRPLESECLPMLRTMALREEQQIDAGSMACGKTERPMRRTRARARQGGFCRLDLDPATVLSLKNAAICPNEESTVQYYSPNRANQSTRRPYY